MTKMDIMNLSGFFFDEADARISKAEAYRSEGNEKAAKAHHTASLVLMSFGSALHKLSKTLDSVQTPPDVSGSTTTINQNKAKQNQ